MRLHLRRRGMTPAALPPRSPAVAIPTQPMPTVPVRVSLPAPALICRYTVLYDRVGEWGTGGTLAPPMLSVCGTTRQEIEDAVRRDIASYLPPLSEPLVIADMAIMAGQIRISGRPAGTFSLRMVGGTR